MSDATARTFEIRHRFTNAVLWTGSANTIKEAVTAAVKRGSNLSGSNLSGSNLSGSNLSGSNLRGSNLSGSNLSGSDLTPVRDDFWAVLSAAPREVAALREALLAGKVDGSSYEGDCACLVGTIAHAAHCRYNGLPILKPDSSRPAERFFLSIDEGDTPATNQVSKIVLGWLDQWLANMQAAFGSASTTEKS
jgi:uncharacterized protein YjbI with pentapeptide repeats